jgi:hypothetical protein
MVSHDVARYQRFSRALFNDWDKAEKNDRERRQSEGFETGPAPNLSLVYDNHQSDQPGSKNDHSGIVIVGTIGFRLVLRNFPGGHQDGK